MDEEWFRRFIERSNWVFAKTMPLTPHWYVLRKQWLTASMDEEFKRAVTEIRKHGHKVMFQGHSYTIYVIDGYKYWSMGWPVDSDRCDGTDHEAANCTILINRAVYPEVQGPRSIPMEPESREPAASGSMPMT